MSKLRQRVHAQSLGFDMIGLELQPGLLKCALPHCAAPGPHWLWFPQVKMRLILPAPFFLSFFFLSFSFFFFFFILKTQVNKYRHLESFLEIKYSFWKSYSHTWLSNFTFPFPFHALEKEMATHSSVLAWRILGTGAPGGLPSMGSHRVGHDWSDLAAAA